MQPTTADRSLARDTGRNDARQALKGLFRGFDPDDWDLSQRAPATGRRRSSLHT